MSNLPEQVHNPGAAVATQGNQPATGIGALTGADIRLPRMKFGQYLSRVVTDELIPYGAIYLVTSRDDMEPVLFAKPAKAKGEVGEPVRFYVLGVKPGWSYTNPQGDLERSRDGSYPDLNLVKERSPRNVRRVYDYTVTLPDYPELPVMFLMHGAWGGQSAKQINTRLMLTQQQGQQTHEVAFAVRARKSESDNGPYASAVVGLAEISAKDKQADLAIVQEHLELLGSSETVVAVDEEDALDARTQNDINTPSLD